MKLYKREDFIELPAGTIYSRMDPYRLLWGLFCKVSKPDEYFSDWVEQDLLGEPGFPAGITDGHDAMEHQKNLRDTFQDFETDLDCGGRDGMFEVTDKFIVWNRTDIRKLRDYLERVLNGPPIT